MVTTMMTKAVCWLLVGLVGLMLCIGDLWGCWLGLAGQRGSSAQFARDTVVTRRPERRSVADDVPRDSAALTRVTWVTREAETSVPNARQDGPASQPAGSTAANGDAKSGLVLPPDSLPATEELLLADLPLGLPALPDLPSENRLTAAKVDLGRRLFFDPLLSADRTVSCATCHQPDHGLASPDPLAIGIAGRVGRRNAPSLFNRAFGQRFFWDGRAESLEAQSLLPIANPDEMGDDLNAILERLAAHPEYPSWFAAAFPAESVGGATAGAVVTAERLAAALAAFQRTLLMGDSPVDRFRAASDVSGLSLEARQGLWIFESRGRCWQCHSGENFSDEQFHNTGVGFGVDNRDLGRFEATGAAEDRFRFKTPSLRGVAETAPYMHDGSVRTLEDVVEFYNRGGAEADRELSPLMRPLNLSDEEKRYLVEFLKALSYQAGPSTAK